MISCVKHYLRYFYRLYIVGSVNQLDCTLHLHCNTKSVTDFRLLDQCPVPIRLIGALHHKLVTHFH